MVEATGVVRSFRKSMQIEKMAKDIISGNTSMCSKAREREFRKNIDKEMIREIGERPGGMECNGMSRGEREREPKKECAILLNVAEKASNIRMKQF